MIQPKKLIEVAMPIKEISAESVRDKSIRRAISQMGDAIGIELKNLF